MSCLGKKHRKKHIFTNDYYVFDKHQCSNNDIATVVVVTPTLLDINVRTSDVGDWAHIHDISYIKRHVLWLLAVFIPEAVGICHNLVSKDASIL